MKSGFKMILKLFAWVSVILLFIRLLISIQSIADYVKNGQIFSIIYNIVGYAGEAITVSGLLAFLYERFFWKWLNFWKIPVLHKQYEGVFVSSSDEKERTAELTIKQTFLSIKITFKTDESWSHSVNESFDLEHGAKLLIYTYINYPDLKLYDKSKTHSGTVTFQCDDVNELKGNYYTDRCTRGTMVFRPKN